MSAADPSMPPFLRAPGEMARRILETDWSRTSVGPITEWPQSLRTSLSMCLASRFPLLLWWGPELRILYNDAYIPIFGKKHPSVLATTGLQAWGEVWDVIGPMLEGVMRQGLASWSEDQLLLLERNGYPEETYFTWSYSPISDETGSVGGVFTAVTETTSRVIGARRLQLLRELAEQAADATDAREACAVAARTIEQYPSDLPFCWIYLTTLDQSLTLIESVGPTSPSRPETVALHDERPLAEVARTGDAILLEDVRERFGDLVGTSWPEPVTCGLVLPIARSGQETPWGVMVAGASPRRALDEDYKAFLTLMAGHIATAVNNAHARSEERRRADRLAEIDRAKTAFFSNVSHEFRTPLTLMLGPTEDALGSPERALRGADLETVHRNELRLLRLVNALLDFARIEAGRIQASYEPTDLAALTADLATSFRSAIERAGLDFEVDCAFLPEAVYVDHDMWEKIVLNLLSNALKFTFEGRISIKLRWQDDHAELTVRDTGVGVAENELPRLFERFHRIEGGRARTHEGSGIGLALVHELVRLHGGSIDVTSKVGEGTAFRITIPHGRSHLTPTHVSTPASRTTTAAAGYVAEALRWIGAVDSLPSPARGDEAGRPRIVVADDNADMRDYIARLLRERWNVEAVGDGQAALDTIRRDPPALVLSDVMMPGLDGFGLIRALREDAVLRSIPVILLSARAGEEASAEGLSAGADDYIVKPFAARDLLVRVTSRLAAAQAAREANQIKENLYRHFMQAPFPVAVFRGRDHVVELANAAVLQAWGKTAEEAVGKPLLSALPELQGQPFIGSLDGVLESGVAHEGHAELARLIGADGQVREAYFSFVYAPLLDARGVAEGILVSAFDVTTQVRARQEIERARDEAEKLAKELWSTGQRLRAAQQVAGIGIFDWDLRTNVVYWSPELYVLMGLRPGAIEATTEAWTNSLYDESDKEAGWRSYREALAAHRPTSEVEVRLRQRDGQSRWVRLSSEIQYDEDGEPTRVLGAVVDIQMLKEAASARARALAEAERTGRAKDEFLATMSHELRTPLNALLGWAKILKSGQLDDKKLRHGLAVIERNAQTQARLVSDLLDVSRIISGKLRLAVQKLGVSAVVNASVDVVRQAAEAKGVELLVKVDPAVGSMVGDPDRLQQIVWNLLSNAVKFTAEKGRITVSARREDSNVCIQVEDNGTGISPEHLPVIFERFAQVDSSTTRSHGGLGLGLAIVRHLAEAHGGTVAASSAGLGSGATFTVKLPLRAVFSDPARSDSAPDPRVPFVSAASDRRLEGSCILILDDDADSLDLLRVLLEDAGASVTRVANAASALEQSTSERFDLVVSDIGMPEMDGYTFMRRLRATHPAIPAIALTAYARAEDATRARAAGYQEHIAKPVDGGELIATIERLLGAVRTL